MTNNCDLLTQIQNIAPWLVNLPNGKQIVATKCGKVILEFNLILENVLYIPQLKCNLLFVP